MSAFASLYEYFGISASCTDSELRGAYRELLFRTHPDRNPQDRDATLKTQRLTKAYAELRAARRSAFSPSAEIGSDIRTSCAGAEAGDEVVVTVFFSFSSAVDFEKVAGIKARLRASWEALRDQPSDPLRALQFIHAAFEGERGDSDLLTRLLAVPLLIDLASTLLFDATGSERDARYKTLSRWAKHLQRAGHVSEAIQILEDAASSGLASTELKDDLRSHHYSAAQYPHPTTGVKPDPERRIVHLRRLIELGYDLDYIHKFLAEAYHDVGDDETARACLEHAYQMNPDLSGAVRITRALGLTAKNRTVEEAASHGQPRWTRPTQIPAPWQIRVWAKCRMWDRIFDFSNPGDYSRRVLPTARATLRTVAATLGGCDHSAAEPVLIELLHFHYYWDVTHAAATALSKVGGSNALAALEEHKSKNGGREEPHLTNCISYLRARIQSANALVDADQTASLAQAMRAANLGQHCPHFGEAKRQDYGLARFLLENLIERLGPEHPDFIKAMMLWARSCAEMNEFERAVEIVRPIYPALRDAAAETARAEANARVTAISAEAVVAARAAEATAGGQVRTLAEVESWLWSSAVFEDYHEARDDLYEWAFDLNLSLISMAATPDGVLGPLRRMTRWLELLGRRASAQVIRQLIRNEAPGTPYVDSHDRENYFRQAVLTDKMQDFLKVFDSRIYTEVIPKLKAVMKSEPWIEAPS